LQGIAGAHGAHEVAGGVVLAVPVVIGVHVHRDGRVFGECVRIAVAVAVDGIAALGGARVHDPGGVVAVGVHERPPGGGRPAAVAFVVGVAEAVAVCVAVPRGAGDDGRVVVIAVVAARFGRQVPVTVRVAVGDQRVVVDAVDTIFESCAHAAVTV